jgi:5-methylcytosine-specific restriction protein A
MTEDVPTTKRKPLTPTQRLKLFEFHRGQCVLCGGKIHGKFIDEHLRALGLGGGNELGNRGIAHPKCAEAKTRGEDMPRINKAKAQKKAKHGIKKAPQKEIVSAPFPEVEKKKNDKNPLGPPRPMFR